jgi:hypothetical protein
MIPGTEKLIKKKNTNQNYYLQIIHFLLLDILGKA